MLSPTILVTLTTFFTLPLLPFAHPQGYVVGSNACGEMSIDRPKAPAAADCQQLKISTWAQPNCLGEYNSPDNVALSGVNTIPKHGLPKHGQIMSYRLSRDLKKDEQLDFSARTADSVSKGGLPKECSMFVEKTNPDSNMNVLKANTCYNLLDRKHALCFRIHGENA